MSQPAPQVDPQNIWNIMTGFQHSAAFKAGVELEVFTKIGEGKKTAADIAAATGAAERGIRILADSLSVLGLLTKSGNEYSLAPDSAVFLDKNSPAYLGSAVDFIMGPTQMRGINDLTNAVRNGGTTVTGDGSVDPESPMWVTFARGMAPLVFPAAQAVAGNVGIPNDQPIKVLDIAAGHGLFGIMVAKAYPNARIDAVDWANVLTVATENAEKFGVADRHHLKPGSAFDVEFDNDYDVVLVPNFLHHFDAKTCTDFMKKVNAALKPNGKAITVEFIPNEDRVSPPAEALFPLIMLAATPGGDAYTWPELEKMMIDAGFSQSQHVPLAPMPMHLVVSSK